MLYAQCNFHRFSILNWMETGKEYRNGQVAEQFRDCEIIKYLLSEISKCTELSNVGIILFHV